MNIIETHNIRKNFGTKIALDGVSIHIPQNEICGFLGPNGAGKTTLMRILTRILQPDDGSILFNNLILFLISNFIVNFYCNPYSYI